MKNIIIIIGLLVIIACSNDNADNIKDEIEYSIKIDKSELYKKYKLSDVIEEIELIPLQSNDSIIITECSKIIIDSVNIYISDKNVDNVYILDREGRMKTIINNLGRGPFEYSNVSDFCVLGNGQIVVLDTQLRKIFFYNSNGTPAFNQKIPFYADALEFLNENVLVFNGSSLEDRIIMWNYEKKRIIKSFIDYNVKYSGKISKPLITFNSDIFWQGEYSTSFLKIDETGIETSRKIDFGKYNIKEPILGPMGAYYLPTGATMISEYNETNDLISFRFQCEILSDLPFFLFYSKQTNKKIILNNEYLDEDITYYTSPPQIKTTTPEGEFVSVLDPYILFSNLSKLKENGRIKDLEKFNNYYKKIESFKLDDNLIICLYKLKDF